MEIYSEPWFRTRLDYYLRERHPQLQYRAQLLDRRSAVAADLYRRTCDAGGSAECALRLADRSLFRGLLFSKFDTIDLILANDFPDIPEDQRRTVARALLTPCEPIFAGYGYTTDDVHYTIGNFSKRKSARLGDIVERAIEMLEREGKFYNREVAVLDTIDNVARRTFTRTVLADSLIRVRSLSDTARLSFSVDVEPGDYQLSLKYLVDSLDRNDKGLKGSVWLERRDSTRTGVYTTTLRRNREETFSRRLTADSSHRRLRIDFLNFTGKPQRPSVTVTDLKVEFTPPTRTAVERLYEQQLDIRIFADEFFRAANPADSL